MTITGGYGVTTGAISGIDIALWDIRGKNKKLPINLLLDSSESRSKVQRYASLSRYGTNEGVSDAVKNLVEAGYNSIKIHQHAKDTLDSAKMIREKVGYDFDLMADLNCGFDEYEMAEDFAKDISRFELKWIEEPLWPPDDFEGLKKLNKLTPVAAGENFFSYHEFKRLLDNECLTYYQPDVTKCGGITALESILELFSEYRAKVALHNRPHNGWVGTVASAHVAAALGNSSTIIETPPNEIPGEYYDFEGKLDKKYIEVAGGGLGISPKEPIPESKGSKLLQFH
jgi:L-alanine-DL-glutamate epimerase-like enolase superfamily enzyme